MLSTFSGKLAEFPPTKITSHNLIPVINNEKLLLLFSISIKGSIIFSRCFPSDFFYVFVADWLFLRKHVSFTLFCAGINVNFCLSRSGVSSTATGGRSTFA